MKQETDHLTSLGLEAPALEETSRADGVIGYYSQECLRFFSIASSLRESSLLENKTAADRQISHILGRSLLEGFFWIIYIFENQATRAERFEEKLNGFRRQYGKYWNENILPGRDEMEPAQEGWSNLEAPQLDLNSMLMRLRNENGDGLNYLYFLYRVSSFDTHGNSMDALFRSAFGKSCNFTALDFEFGFGLIARHYLQILHRLRHEGEI